MARWAALFHRHPEHRTICMLHSFIDTITTAARTRAALRFRINRLHSVILRELSLPARDSFSEQTQRLLKLLVRLGPQYITSCAIFFTHKIWRSRVLFSSNALKETLELTFITFPGIIFRSSSYRKLSRAGTSEHLVKMAL